MTRYSSADKTACEQAVPQSGSWPLQDAKAYFSELLRLVRSEGPQYITVDEGDEVVVMAADHFHRLQGGRTGQTLIDVMQASPYRDVEL
jgi:prevent-host-death family protein